VADTGTRTSRCAPSTLLPRSCCSRHDGAPLPRNDCLHDLYGAFPVKELFSSHRQICSTCSSLTSQSARRRNSAIFHSYSGLLTQLENVCGKEGGHTLQLKTAISPSAPAVTHQAIQRPRPRHSAGVPRLTAQYYRDLKRSDRSPPIRVCVLQ
jgi:hypothetical protein